MAEDIDEIRRDALTAFLRARVREGYRIETRTDHHAIIVPGRWTSIRHAIDFSHKIRGRQVISVDDQAKVTMSPAEPLRS
jgi:hypothetical protein